MHRRFKPLLRAAAVCSLSAHTLLAGAQGEPLQLLGRTPVLDYEGDFDHLAADLEGHRLFVAGEDKGTLEVFDLRTGAHLKTVPGLGTPHALHYLPRTKRLIVTNSGDAMSAVLEGKTLRRVATVRLAPGADAMGYDASVDHAWIVTGGKNAEPKLARTIVSEVDASTGKKLGDVSFDTDFTEGIAAEQKGMRLFANLAGLSTVAVLDKRTRKQLASWPIVEGRNNSAIALDEDNQRLFVVTRKPFKLIVLDTATGRSVASFDAPQRTNDLIFDKARRRVYLTGDDYVATFEQKDADHYEELPRVKSDNGAKTALLVPELDLLYVAVAGTKTTAAGLLRYRIEPSAAR